MQNILRKTKTYLVGSMQYKNGESWRQYFQKSLATIGVVIFNPYDKPFLIDVEESDTVRDDLTALLRNEKYDDVQNRMRMIRSYDLNLVDRSDFIIAYIDPTVPTFGSIEELTTAVRAKKPIFMFVEGGKKLTPLWLLGMIPHKYIYNTKEEVLAMLHRIDGGEVAIDSNRWRLLKEEYR